MARCVGRLGFYKDITFGHVHVAGCLLSWRCWQKAGDFIARKFLKQCQSLLIIQAKLPHVHALIQAKVPHVHALIQNTRLLNDVRSLVHKECLFNRLTPRDAYLRKRCVYHYQRILPDPLKDYTNLKLFVFIASIYIAEIHSCT